MKDNINSQVYLHIGNGGVNFSIVDNGYGPTIVIASRNLGNNTSTQKIHTNVKSLKELGKLFTNVDLNLYSEEYVYPARSIQENDLTEDSEIINQ